MRNKAYYNPPSHHQSYLVYVDDFSVRSYVYAVKKKRLTVIKLDYLDFIDSDYEMAIKIAKESGYHEDSPFY